MRTGNFSWGPLARGLYTALLWCTIIIGWHYPGLLVYYVALMIFLGLGLRPLLEFTGLDAYLSRHLDRFEERRWKSVTRRKRLEVALGERDKSYRHTHRRDPRLPKNW
ncbi:MAG: hypothetical protein R3228_14035 [Halioglobus sp.]|nr:hypothetical protein [Halioglobus sp.]